MNFVLLTIRTLIGYGLPLLMGVIIVDLLEGKQKLFIKTEKVGLGFMVGYGIQALYIFFLGLFRIQFTFLSCSLLIWVILLIGLIRLKNKKRLLRIEERSERRPVLNWKTAVISAIILLILWKYLFSFAGAFLNPSYFDDTVSIWNYKAKVFYAHRSLVLQTGHVDFLGGLVQKYPPGIPLFKAWISICLGGWHEWAVNLITFSFFASLGLIAYGNFRCRYPRGWSLIMTYIISSVPLLGFHSFFAHVDMMIGISLFAGGAYLYRWIETEKINFLVISAILIGSGVFIKDEGLILMVTGFFPPLLLYLLIKVRDVKKILSFAALVLGVVIIWTLPWYLTKVIYGFPISLPPEYRRLEFHPEVFRMMIYYIFSSGNYNILFPTAFITMFLGAKIIITSSLRYIFLAWLGVFLMTIYPFVFSPFFEFMGTAFGRAVVTSVPLLAFGVCLVWGRWLSGSQE
jgi:dolichyl-phosphate-mannose-protein mannosyltransferase